MLLLLVAGRRAVAPTLHSRLFPTLRTALARRPGISQRNMSVFNISRLQNKTVLVTGASVGIGAVRPVKRFPVGWSRLTCSNCTGYR